MTPCVLVVDEPADRVRATQPRWRAGAERGPPAVRFGRGPLDGAERQRALRWVGLHDLFDHVLAEHDAQSKLPHLPAGQTRVGKIVSVCEGECASAVRRALRQRYDEHPRGVFELDGEPGDAGVVFVDDPASCGRLLVGRGPVVNACVCVAMGGIASSSTERSSNDSVKRQDILAESERFQMIPRW